MPAEPQMCTVDDMVPEPPCLRVAQWRWEPPGEHPVFLCNFHAEPLTASVPPQVSALTGGTGA